MPKVNTVIAGTPERGLLMPMGDGTYRLGVLKPIQEAARIGSGDSITIDIELDPAPRTVELPGDLAAAIKGDKQAIAAWHALAFTKQKEMGPLSPGGQAPADAGSAVQAASRYAAQAA